MMQRVGIRPEGPAAASAAHRVHRGEEATLPPNSRDAKTSGSRKAASAPAVEKTAATARPGITLEVMDGPMDGAVFAGLVDAVGIGRGADNDLKLLADRSVSSRHAVLTWAAEDGSWSIEDRKSTNGTWVAGTRLSAPCRLDLGSDFLVGNAVVRAMPYEGAAPFLPRAEQLRTELQRLVTRLTPEAAQGYGAALGVAVQERRAFLTERHLFIGLAIANPSLPAIARGKGPLGTRLLGGPVRQNEYWVGASAWIDRHLRAVGRDEEILFESDLATTPRVLHVLQRAAERAGSRGDERIMPSDLLVAMLSGLSPRLIEILAREGVDAEVVVGQIEEAAEKGSAANVASSGAAIPSAARTAPPVQLSSGDPAVDNRARETARELYGISSLYHLAAPEERRTALKQALTHALSQVPGEARDLFLSQLRGLFPIISGVDVNTAEVAGLRTRIGELERSAGGPANPAQSASAVPPWRLVAVREDDPELAAVGAEDRAALRLLREVLAFATAVERFVVGMVSNLTMQGRVTDVFLLPGFRTNLLRHSEHLAQGKPIKIDEVREYLSAVEAWLVAATAAYHEAPEIWFREFWKKANPAAIEAGVQEPGRKKVFRIEAVELWEQYKTVVRPLSPELVADEILHIVRKRAEEQFARLRERSVQR